MHAEAHSWVAQYRSDESVTVLDIGGRNINGTTRDLFPHADYTTIDIAAGEGVDIVADAGGWVPDREYDLVVCTEVFEHTASWPQIIATAFKALRPGGQFVATMAGPGRPPHSAVDGGWTLHPGEYYGNVAPEDLRRTLEEAGFVVLAVDRRSTPADVRCAATRPDGG